MKRVKRRVHALLFVLLLVVSLAIPTGTASAVSDYDNLLHVTPTLYVYTDGSAKAHKMDISTTWWAEFKQTYAKRVAQNIGWPANFVSEFEDIAASGGSWGVFSTETSDGRTINIVGTHDPDAYCSFVGSASSGFYQCASNPGYGFISAGYFTHNSYGGNGCMGSYGNRCSDTGMNIYQGPEVQLGTAGYTFLSLPNMALSDYQFFFMNFDLTYPTGYEGALIPTEPPTAKYVGMGDSVSSAEANPPFEAGTAENGVNECHRSPQAYPRLLQSDLNLGPTAFVACSGASTDNVLHGQGNEPPQVDALSASTEKVTITIGANDIGFKEFAIACSASICNFSTSAYSTIVAKINNELPGRLEGVFEEIDSRVSSTTKVYVIGYAHIAPPEMPTGANSACWPLNGQGDDPDPALNDGATVRDVVSRLNGVIADTVDEMGDPRFTYIDPNLSGSPFVGHDWCKQDRYFDTIVVNNIEYSFHPNANGHNAYKTVIKNVISQ